MQPEVPTEQDEIAAPPQNSILNDTNNFDAPIEAPVKEEPAYGNGNIDDSGQSWNVDQVNGIMPNQYNDAQMEQDLPPIGIKEDG